MDSYDLVVVWDLGNMSNGSTQQAPWAAAGGQLAVTLLQLPGGWELRWGVQKRKLIVLSEIL